MIEVDGSYLEGGGQILRTAVGLAAATGQDCRVFNIRKGREKPGLQPQHLRAVEAVAAVCGAELTGAALHSTEITFKPRTLRLDEKLSVQVGTAGAVTLVMQALMIPLIRMSRETTVVITGGTHVPWSPVAEYFEHAFAAHLRQMGPAVRFKLKRYGFYPKGGGKIEVEVKPARLIAPDRLERGNLLRHEVWSIATQDLRHAGVAERQIEGARRRLEFEDEHIDYVQAPSTGTAIFICSRFENALLGASALGARGKPAEKVGRECAGLLLEQLDGEACLDEHMSDQMLPYMALAENDSTAMVAGITDHCRTNMWVIEKFLPVKFEADLGRRLVSCRRL